MFRGVCLSAVFVVVAILCFAGEAQACSDRSRSECFGRIVIDGRCYECKWNSRTCIRLSQPRIRCNRGHVPRADRRF
jgi:hypothetical protein